MSFRDRLALTFPPLLIRLVLALTFVWAGLGKVTKTNFSAEDAAALANMGVQTFVDQAGPPIVVVPDPVPVDDGLVHDDEQPGDPIPGDTEVDSETVDTTIEDLIEEVIPGEGPGEEPPAEVVDPETIDPETVDPPDDPGLAYRQASDFRLLTVQNADEGEGDPVAADTPPADTQAQPAYTADRFPADGVDARALNKIVLMLDGSPFQDYALYLAWLAALTELIGGLLLIPGILSRIWGLGLAIAMGMALWLTTISASVGSPDAFLGFWPSIAVSPGDDGWWPLVTGFWQLALGVMALSIFLSGAGRISVDALFFGPGSGRKSKHAGDD
jgi:uncharacterized membrane protein YphA (DoxX/SURF4 family)